MKNLLFTILFISVSVSVFSQDLNFDIQSKSLTYLLNLEETLGSRRITPDSKYISFSGDAQPIIFIRKEKAIPDLTVYYFFKEKDSVLSYILYEWDVYNFEKQDNNKKTKEFQDALIKKYEDTKNHISTLYGSPEIKRNYSNIARLDPDIFEENAIWKPNSEIEIEMFITVSNFYEKRGAITFNPHHRIRLYVRNNSVAQD